MSTALSAASIAQEVKDGSTTASAVLEQFLTRIETHEGAVRSFVTETSESARMTAESIDERIRLGEDPGPLAGVPLALKDNLCTSGLETTCASRILQGWKPPYDATVVSRLVNAGAVIVGKTNMDEFAMGSSTEHSYMGPTRNPYDLSRVPGGSSGGSAATVAAGFSCVALGSDTGGSIRQPAAFCGVVGVKPTYGLVSRYGLVAFASSLDQIGPFARSVRDAAITLEVISGPDSADSTCIKDQAAELVPALERGAQGLRVGVVKELVEGASVEVTNAVMQSAQALEAAGATVEETSLPACLWALSAYYLLAPAEASSNLARYDGVRYGLRVDARDVEAMNCATRSAGFGDEVKRRIMLGTFALSAGYYDAYYGQAQRVRTLIIEAFNNAYEKFDVLIGATAPSGAFPLGARTADPMQMYLSDVFTIPSNLAGHPAISVPWGTDGEGMPLAVQVLAPALGEPVMFQTAAVIESAAPPLPDAKIYEGARG